MTSVFLTRRAMLSGSAMLSIGTLFAACGQQAANEAVAAASAAPSPLRRLRQHLSRLRQAQP